MKRKRTMLWVDPFHDLRTLTTRHRLTGFSDANTLCDATITAPNGVSATVSITLDRPHHLVTAITNAPNSTLPITFVSINGLLQTETTASVSTPTWHLYDALGREVNTQTPLGFTSTTTYDPATGQVTATKDQAGQTTSYQYYAPSHANAGKPYCQSRSNGKKTYYDYDNQGRQIRVWGDVPYPQENVYDSTYGDLIELHTFRGGNNWSSSTWPGSGETFDKTSWSYDAATGLVLSKTDASNHAYQNDYYPTRDLKTRTWARGATITYAYNVFGDTLRRDYSDGTPSVVLDLYNAAGQPRTVADATGSATLDYDPDGQLLSYTYGAGNLLAGIAVANHYDNTYGRDQLEVDSSETPILTHTFGYDANSGRLQTVSSGNYSATYGYLPNSDLLRTTTCKNDTSIILTTTRAWDYGSRLSAIINEVSGLNVSSHSYTYDSLNRRTRDALEDGSVWVYDYNDRDELTGARRFWPDWAPVAGQQFGYDYDNIGNRKTATFGGDVNGCNVRTISYTANELNQYNSVTTPGYENIIGAAFANYSVTVNGGQTDRKGEYFHQELPITNSTSPVWQNVTVQSGTFTDSGGIPLPKNNQTLNYDLDGNLKFDGIWNYEWDAENRLISMTMTNTLTSLIDAHRLRLEFAYDYQNRRISKTVRHWDGTSSFVDPLITVFLYDGRNLIAELDASDPLSAPSPVRSYMWGQDLSGTMGGAGGVGGLLLFTTHGSAATNCFAPYDGNGDVTGLINASDLSTAARYEYSPFGETLRATGSLRTQDPLRFSTKFTDDETGLIYYGFRYYSAACGRWTSRDPLQEQGGPNAYAALDNSPANRVDSDGRMILGKQWFKNLFAAAATLFTATRDNPRIGIKAVWDAEREAQRGARIEAASKIAGKGTDGGFGPPPDKWYHAGRGVIWGLVLVSLEATLREAWAVGNALSGVRSEQDSVQYALEGSVINTLRGDTAYADLDAIDAALLMTGGAGADALEAWDTFAEANDMLSDALAGLSCPGSPPN